MAIFFIELLSTKDKTCLLLGKPVPDLVLHRLSQVRSLPKDIQLVTSMKGTFFHQNNVKLANNYLKCEIADGSLVHLLLPQFLLDLDQGSLILSFIFDLNKQAPE